MANLSQKAAVYKAIPGTEWNSELQCAVPITRMEETMNTTTTNPNTDLVLTARRSLNGATFGVYLEYMSAMEKKYGLRDEDQPKSAEDLINKIKEGKYVAPDTAAEDYDSDDYRWEPYFGLKFRDPSMKKDRPGYEKAMEAFNAEKAVVDLKISVLEPAEALKFVESFKTKHTVH